MRKRVLAILTVGLLLGAGAAADDSAKNELKKLQGTWKLVKLEIAGKPLPEQATDGKQIVIKGDQFSMEGDGKVAKSMGIKIDPTQKPKAMDMLISRGEEKVTWKCIYALEGDTLKICMPLAPKKGQDAKTEGYGVVKRPESFDALEKPFMVFTAERQKK